MIFVEKLRNTWIIVSVSYKSCCNIKKEETNKENMLTCSFFSTFVTLYVLDIIQIKEKKGNMQCVRNIGEYSLLIVS